MFRTPVEGYIYVVDPAEVPYDPSVYHLVWDISYTEDTFSIDFGGDNGDELVPLCQPRDSKNQQLLKATPAALDGFTLCQNCKRRLHPNVKIPYDIDPSWRVVERETSAKR